MECLLTSSQLILVKIGLVRAAEHGHPPVSLSAPPHLCTSADGLGPPGTPSSSAGLQNLLRVKELSVHMEFLLRDIWEKCVQFPRTRRRSWPGVRACEGLGDSRMESSLGLAGNHVLTAPELSADGSARLRSCDPSGIRSSAGKGSAGSGICLAGEGICLFRRNSEEMSPSSCPGTAELLCWGGRSRAGFKILILSSPGQV